MNGVITHTCLICEREMPAHGICGTCVTLGRAMPQYHVLQDLGHPDDLRVRAIGTPHATYLDAERARDEAAARGVTGAYILDSLDGLEVLK